MTKLGKQTIMALIAALLLFLGATYAFAQQGPQCTATDKAYKVLYEEFKEVRLGLGLTPDGQLLEMWANPESGTWTLLVTNPAGVSCIVASGAGWQSSEHIFGDPV